MILLFAILAPLVTAIFANAISKSIPRAAPWVFASIPALLGVALMWQYHSLNIGESLSLAFSWVPSLNVAFDLRLDGLGLLFSILITSIGTFIFLYAGGYLKTNTHGKFYTYILLFMASMLGIVIADNTILLFVFWELTGISSYLIIGFNNESKNARNKALQALLVTGLGGIALLAGLIFLSEAAGSYRLSEIIAQGPKLASHNLAQIALPLILLGAFTKSAQFPFHFWLPNAMAAPTPASAYLHSATMVKAGVFLLLKLQPIYGQLNTWTVTLSLIGGTTLVYGSIRGLFQRDVKRILAFTTMAVLGMLVMLVGQGSYLATKSALLFLFGHAFYKATLFMIAGNIDHATATRDVRILGGLKKAMPWTALAAGLAAISKGGFPPMLGFIGKEYVYKASSSLEIIGPWITGTALIGNILLLSLAFKVGIHPFWAHPHEKVPGRPWSKFLPSKPHETNFLTLVGPLTLATIGLVLGLTPQIWSGSIIDPALTSALGLPTHSPVYLWHGFNLPLLLSCITLIAGITIYLFRQSLWRRELIGTLIADKDSEKIYNFGLNQFVQKSKELTAILQNGSLRFYLWVILLSAGLLVGYKILTLGTFGSIPNFQEIGIFYLILCAALTASLLYTAFSGSIIASLASLGFAGFGIALIYAIFGAPDLAITQIIVETLSIILILLAAQKLPTKERTSKKSTKWLDIALASFCGLFAFILTYKAAHLQLSSTISTQLTEWSYLEAKGRNVVNVILVDFRALDTFGEIIVIGIAAIGVALCLDPDFSKNENHSSYVPIKASPVLDVGAKLMLPLCIFVSIVLLYRGHNEPGGGFIGGLMCATGFIIHSLTFGSSSTLKKLRLNPIKWIALGISVSISSGFAAVFFSESFMKGLWLPALELPILGHIHLGTPLLFDLGVYLVVLGFATQCAFAFQAANSALRSPFNTLDK